MTKKKEPENEGELDFSNELWYRVYYTEPLDQKRQPLLARSLRDFLGRVARRHSDVLVSNCATVERAIADVLLTQCAHPDEWDLCVRHMKVWIEEGVILVVEDKRKARPISLHLHRHMEGQQAKSGVAARKAASRDREKWRKFEQLTLASPATIPVTSAEHDRDTSQDSPVDSHPDSPVDSRVSVTADKIRQDKIRQDKTRETPSSPAEAAAELRKSATAFLRNPTEAAFRYGHPHTWHQVVGILQHFNRVWGQQGMPITSGDDRVRAILELLASGYEVGQLMAAIEGAFADDWMRENAPRLKSILKNGEAVDNWATRATRPGRGGGGARVQPGDPGYYAGDMGYGANGNGNGHAEGKPQKPPRPPPKKIRPQPPPPLELFEDQAYARSTGTEPGEGLDDDQQP